MRTGVEVIFMDYKCDVHFEEYADNGALAILLVDSLENYPVATATVNLDDVPDHGYVYIKEYSENVGMTQCLIDGGVIDKDYVSIEINEFKSIVNLCRLEKSLIDKLIKERS